MGSDASSSMCSANGITEAMTTKIWPKLFDARSPNTISLAPSINSNDGELVNNERVEEELIDDVITNDLVIIDGVVLHRNDLEQHQLNYSNSNATNVMLNDSSNEVSSLNILINYYYKFYHTLNSRFSDFHKKRFKSSNEPNKWCHA